MILVHRAGQADGGGALHGAEPENAARPRILHRVARLLGERQQPVGIAEQHLPGRRQMQALAFANEERDADIFLELADARRHIGLNAIQPLARPGSRRLRGPRR